MSLCGSCKFTCKKKSGTLLQGKLLALLVFYKGLNIFENTNAVIHKAYSGKKRIYRYINPYFDAAECSMALFIITVKAYQHFLYN